MSCCHVNKSLILFFLYLSGIDAQAVDFTISGKVVATPCSVETNLASGKSIDLGTLGRTRFQAAGNAGDWQDFVLNLTGCPIGTSQVTTTFTGTPDSNDATLFANTEPAVTAATNIAIQMAQAGNTRSVLSNNSSMTINVDNTTRSAVFPLAARMYTPTGGTQAGLVSGTVLISFTYQ